MWEGKPELKGLSRNKCDDRRDGSNFFHSKAAMGLDERRQIVKSSRQVKPTGDSVHNTGLDDRKQLKRKMVGISHKRF